MVVAYKNDPNFVNGSPIDPARLKYWNGIVIRLKYEPHATVETDAELALPVPLQRVRVTGNKIGYRRSSADIGKTGAEFTSAIGSQFALGEAALFAEAPQPGVSERQLDRHVSPVRLHAIGPIRKPIM
jgi:hypothetical protein